MQAKLGILNGDALDWTLVPSKGMHEGYLKYDLAVNSVWRRRGISALKCALYEISRSSGPIHDFSDFDFSSKLKLRFQALHSSAVQQVSHKLTSLGQSEETVVPI